MIQAWSTKSFWQVQYPLISRPFYPQNGKNNVRNRWRNLSCFWRANNLVKFRNFKKYLWIPKDNTLDRPSVKLQLIMSSHRGDTSIYLGPIFFHGCNLSHFGIFVLGYTRFYIFFGVMGKNQNYELLYQDVQKIYRETI